MDHPNWDKLMDAQLSSYHGWDEAEDGSPYVPDEYPETISDDEHAQLVEDAIPATTFA
jgi:hypothetical protein